MSYPTVIVFVLYLFVIFGIGYYAYRATHTMTDFVLGGRQLSGPVTALSVGASDMSGWLLLGLPGAVYFSGLGNLWLALGLLIGAYVNWRVVAPRLRERSEAMNAITLSEFFEKRFAEDGRGLKLISAVAIILFFTFYTAAGLKTGATLFEQSFGLNYQVALWVGGALIVAYTLFGGFLAVSWTDFFQGILMLVALLVTPLAVWLVNSSDWGTVIQAASTTQSLDWQWPHELGIISILSLMAWGLGYFGQPHILVRFMGIRSVGALGSARRLAMLWMFLALAGAVMVGIAGIVYFDASPQAKALATSSGAESVFILLVQVIFNPWIAGLLLAAILSAVMSTIDSQLLVSSSAVTKDILQSYFPSILGEKSEMMVGRLAVVVIALVALVLATDREGTILGLVAYAWAGLGAAFGPVVLFSLVWKKMTGVGAFAGIIVGASTVIIWKQLSGGIFDIYELLPAFIFASMAIWMASLWSSKRLLASASAPAEAIE